MACARFAHEWSNILLCEWETKCSGARVSHIKTFSIIITLMQFSRAILWKYFSSMPETRSISFRKIQCSIAVSLEELEAEWNWSSGYHLCELEKFLSIAHLSGGEVEDSWMKMVWNSFDSSTIDPVRKIGMLSKQGISALSRKICLWNVHFHTKRLINSQEWAWWLKSTTKPLLSFQPQKQFSW